MKNIWDKYRLPFLVILMVTAVIVNFSFSFAATGDKPNQSKLSAFDNISNSHQVCTKGELRGNSKKLFYCFSTNTFASFSGARF